MTAIAICVPIFAAIFLGFFGSPMRGAYANLGTCIIVFGVTLLVFYSPGSGMLQADPLGMVFGLLSGFVALTTAINNVSFVQNEESWMSRRSWRVYHAMCQVVLGATLLGLYTDNIGLLWAAVEAATIAAALGVSLPRSAAALAAAWKYFCSGGAGILLALFGSVVLYMAAQPALPGLAGLSFSALSAHAAQLDGRLLSLAFIFLLFGYGATAALAPLHAWLPDACAQGPAPLTTSLSGLLLNVGLIAILRFRHLLQANLAAGGDAMAPGPFLLTLGLASLLLTAFSLWRRQDARWFFGFSSIGHSGIAIFAFGIGGAAAIFGGVLHMLLHTLIKSALFQALTRAATLRGGGAAGNYGFGRLRGMLASNKALAWLLGGCVFALTGLPPSGLFTSEFLIVSQTIQREPALSLGIGLGLAFCAIGMIRLIGPLLFYPPPRHTVPVPAGPGIIPIFLHLLLVLLLGFAMPLPLVRMFSNVAGGLQ